jgi:hypothetical protein
MADFHPQPSVTGNPRTTTPEHRVSLRANRIELVVLVLQNTK